MSNTQTNANTVGAVTAAHNFDQISFKGELLFAVRQGAPLSDAFDKLISLITASRDNLCTLAENPAVANVTGGLEAPVHLLSLASELVCAMHKGHNSAERGGRAL